MARVVVSGRIFFAGIAEAEDYFRIREFRFGRGASFHKSKGLPGSESSTSRFAAFNS